MGVCVANTLKHELPASCPRTKEKGLASLQALGIDGVPTGIRTPVTAVKGRCPRPLDDGDPDDGVTRQL
jgi:hypothetical protein